MDTNSYAPGADRLGGVVEACARFTDHYTQLGNSRDKGFDDSDQIEGRDDSDEKFSTDDQHAMDSIGTQ